MPKTMEVLCPKCQSPTWDNRAEKRNPRAPDYKCTDKNCDGVIWPPKPGQRAPVSAQPANGKQGFSAGPALPGENTETGAPPDVESGSVYPKLKKMLDVYTVCWEHAQSLSAKDWGPDASHEATAAMCATLYIQACQKGIAV